MRERLDELVEHAAIDSVQKRWLAGRAVFVLGYLESLDAYEGKRIDFGSYLQAINSLSGVLKHLGLEKQFRKQVDSLTDYIDSRSNGNSRR